MFRKRQEDVDVGDGGDNEDEKLQAPVGNKKQRKAARKAKKQIDSEDLDESSSSEALSSGAATPIDSTSKPATRGPTVMAGGRRRKGAPRKVARKKGEEAGQGSEQ